MGAGASPTNMVLTAVTIHRMQVNMRRSAMFKTTFLGGYTLCSWTSPILISMGRMMADPEQRIGRPRQIYQLIN